MSKALAREVRTRAKDRCEYCQLPQACYRSQFEIDHIIAEQHGGSAISDNLALACIRCNKRKGPNIAELREELMAEGVFPLES